MSHFKELSDASGDHVNAAVYARKSTQQHVADEAKSVTRQVDGARAFIAAKGWTLDETNIYTDDGKSGALFASRAEFQRMMRDAAAGAFDMVVFFDLDLFGRDAEKSMAALRELDDCGVTVWDYSTGLAINLDTFEGRLPTILKRSSRRSSARLFARRRVRRCGPKRNRGWHTGNRIFGYDNLRIEKGHSELRINEHEAKVVRDIYRHFAAGAGARSIAEILNRAGVAKPRAQKGRRDGWSVSTIRAVLSRPLYRGELVFGRTMKAWGRELRKVHRRTKREKGQIRRPEETWIRRDVPALRIIDPDLAARVDERLDDRRSRYLAARARNDGTAAHRAHGRYLLSGGMLLCPTCGGHFEARKYPWRVNEPGGHQGHVYICATRRRKPGVCTNTLALDIAEADDGALHD